MKRRRAILNPDKDQSAAAAFDPDRMLPREALELLGYKIPFGEHPDDDQFVIEEIEDEAA